MSGRLLLVIHGDVTFVDAPPLADRFEHEVVEAAGGWLRRGLAGYALSDREERVRDLVANARRWCDITVIHLAPVGAVGRARVMANAGALPGYSPAYCAMKEEWNVATVASAIAYTADKFDVKGCGYKMVLAVVRETPEFAEELTGRLAVQMDALAVVVTVHPTLGLIERDIRTALAAVTPPGIDAGKVELERSKDEPF
jgi:hypothetical protein